VKGFLANAASLGSPGLDQVRFLQPVRPDTVYAASFVIREVIASQKRPDRGRILGRLELKDPQEILVYSWDGLTILARR